jgi:hypothetical protein
MQHFYFCFLSYVHSSRACFGLTRPSSGVVTLTKIVAMSLQFSHIVTFNKNPLKSIKYWCLLIASSVHCQLCVISVIYNNCIALIFLPGIYNIFAVNVLLCYRSYMYLHFLHGVLVLLLVELFWL